MSKTKSSTKSSTSSAKTKPYMDVPSAYDVMGMTITVEHRKLDSDTDGEFHASKSKVYLAPQKNTDILLATFWHEYVHSVLTTLGYTKLNDDDVFVDRIAQCLQQFFKTRR